jgi:hypothetical protein
MRIDADKPAPRESPELLREELRRKDADWERSGIWESQRDAAREAEDRVRRDASRAIGM